MLGTLLEKVGTLLPKNFIIANLFPMLLFAAANGLMLYWMSGGFHVAVENYFAMSAGSQALIGFPILIALTLAAYICSTLNLFQREILEGRYLPKFWKSPLTAGQQRRLDHADAELLRVKEYGRSVRQLNGQAKLLAARLAGNKTQAPCEYSKTSRAAASIAVLAGKRLRHDYIDPPELKNAIGLLEAELRRCAVDQGQSNDPDAGNKILLDDDQITLLKCLDYAGTEADNDYLASFNEKEFNYSNYRLAPTAMGNIAESVRGYALSRYHMNLDPIWSRLQKIIIDDDNFYSTLVDAKTQLDFLISLFWVTVTFTIIWTIELLYLRRSITAFLIVAIGGPLLSILWYQIALQNYRAFADICRTSIDLYRFDLLELLHLERPRGNEHERDTWSNLNEVIGFGNPDAQIRYHHPPQSS